MGFFNATARTNYFQVKDEAARIELEAWCKATGNRFHLHDKKPLFCMVSGNEDDGAFRFWSPGAEEDQTETWWDTICHVLADGQCLVAMEAGSEKLRYVCGHATAIRADGESVELSLDEIYQIASDKLGIFPTPAEYTRTSAEA